jgi:hypothetical protein
MSNRSEYSGDPKTRGEFIVTPPTSLQRFDTIKQLEIERACVRESEDRLSAYHVGEMSAMSIDEAMHWINKL